MKIFNNTQKNRILSSLPLTTMRRLQPALDHVLLQHGDVLHEPGKEMEYIYFPTSAFISLEHSLQDGRSAEVAGIGNEGMLDASLYSASKTTFARAVVRIAGHVYRIDASLVLSELGRSGQLAGLFLRYTRVLITQVSQAVACGRHHSAEQQLCRWILLVDDGVPGHRLAISLDKVMALLGARSEALKLAASSLEAAGCITVHHDHIYVTDRSGLEARACECYGALRWELDQMKADTASLLG